MKMKRDVAQFPLDEITTKYLIYVYIRFFALVSSKSAASRSATQHATPPEFSVKWRMECLNTTKKKRMNVAINICKTFLARLLVFIVRSQKGF